MLTRHETEISSHKETSDTRSHKARTCKETGSIQQCLTEIGLSSIKVTSHTSSHKARTCKETGSIQQCLTETGLSSIKVTSHTSSHKGRTCKETGSIQQCLTETGLSSIKDTSHTSSHKARTWEKTSCIQQCLQDKKLDFQAQRRGVAPVVTKPGSRQVTAMLDTKLKFHVTWRQATPVVTKQEPGKTQATCSSAHKKRNWTFKHKGGGVTPAVTKQVSGRRWVMAMLTRQKTEISHHKDKSHTGSHKAGTWKETCPCNAWHEMGLSSVKEIATPVTMKQESGRRQATYSSTYKTRNCQVDIGRWWFTLLITNKNLEGGKSQQYLWDKNWKETACPRTCPPPPPPPQPHSESFQSWLSKCT